MKRNHVALLCALALTAATSFSLLGCGGCSGTRHQAADKSDAPAAESAAPAVTLKAQQPDLKGVSLRPIEADADRKLLSDAVGMLSQRERDIITMRFGLWGQKELTQKEVADRLGISQSYISRLEKRIILRLRREIVKMS